MGCEHGWTKPLEDCGVCQHAEALRLANPPVSDELVAQLSECADEIAKVIEAQKAWHQREVEAGHRDPNVVTIYSMTDMAGRPLIGDLLAARAQVLVALARAGG